MQLGETTFMPSYIIVAIGILVVLVLIIKLRINAFIALIAAALAVSFLAPGDMSSKVPRVAAEFGIAAGKIGLVIGFAAVIGEAMMRSGAADRIVQAFLAVLGVKRAPWALMGSGFVLSVPVFFDTVFYLLVPLARSLYAKTNKNFLLYVLAISAGGAITHTLVPPTPGPLAMALTLDVPVGLMIVVGGIVALPAAVAGIFFSRFLDKRVTIESLQQPEAEAASPPESAAAAGPTVPLWEALLPVILPVILISGDTVVDTLREKGEVVSVEWVEGDIVHVRHKKFGQFTVSPNVFEKGPKIGDTAELVLETEEVGQKTEVKNAAAVVPNLFNRLKRITTVLGNAALALAISMTLSLITWVRLRRPEGREFSQALETALLSGGLVILITAAGGAFGSMLKLTGIAGDIQTMFEGGQAVGLVSIFLAFGMAALLKVAQGSSTTAMITVSAMVAAMNLTPEQLGFNLVYICTAIGAGSLIGSWMNDSGFWIVAKMSGLSETEALKTWTPLLLVLGCVSLLMTILLSYAMPLASVT
jgi:GntP family gluconate:H+ symporter